MDEERGAIRRLARRRLPSKRIARLRCQIKRRLRAAGVPVENPMVSTQGLIALVYGVRPRPAA